MAYTPQFTQREAGVVRRVAWAMELPMTKAISVIIELAVQCSDPRRICNSCKDNRFCAECPFSKPKSELVKCTEDETCPHCGESLDELWEWFSHQSDPKFDCHYCGKPIQGQEVITYKLCGGEDGR